MKKILKIFSIPIIVILLSSFIILTSGCSLTNESDNIQHNIKKDADDFKTYRKVTVINLRSDKILLEIEGYISIKDSTADELAIIIQTGRGQYKMHYVYTGSEIVYLVEQLENTNTDPYHWKIRIFAVTPDIETGRND